VNEAKMREYILRALAVLLSICCGACKQTVSHNFMSRPPGEKGECVVLVHGLGRSADSMNFLQERLHEQGYDTVSLDYPSTALPIEDLAQEYLPKAIAECQKTAPQTIHLVSHSLGGIIIRQAFKDKRPNNLGRVVMLSPPNHGSEVADTLKNFSPYRWFFGPVGAQLGTENTSLPNQLGAVTYPVGVITGDRHAPFDTWFADIIPGDDDGKVSVKSARLDGMSDFLVVHESHPFIMNSVEVADEVIHFLHKGHFDHEK